jgi:prepilin peptidase CpaA
MSMLVSLQTICLAAFALLLAAAAWQDLRTMKIANRLSLAIVGVFAVWAACGLALDKFGIADLGIAVACSLVVFAFGALAFSFGAFGGGDVKLLAAASLFAGPALLPDLLLVMAFVGGAMGCAIAFGARIGPQVGSNAQANGATLAGRLRGSLPYGPAIAAGGLWTIAGLI